KSSGLNLCTGTGSKACKTTRKFESSIEQRIGRESNKI
uniref:NAD kinase 2, mitochondrial n=1 Tax=Chinchilla lanigera TaxID=34839 RepID=A0A8C2YN52_CHILA